MRSRLHRRLVLPLIVVIATLGGCARAMDGALPGLPRNGRLPEDTTVIRGKLWNGLTYYVRANREPRARAELRLVVNAGSVQEEEDQRGLAHFVEHMAFNGTARFAQNELVDYLEGVGMRFGPDVNAYTSFDETVYLLTLPTDAPGALDTGLRILRDWAGGITFDSTEVRKERGVVTEEWRSGRGAGARVRDRQLPVLFRGSRYADRLPIGDPALLRSFNPVALVRYYRTWYRPDRMAVVVVGDFDAREMERRIRAEFAALLPVLTPAPRASAPPPRPRGVRFTVAADPELTRTAVTLLRTTPTRARRTVAGYRSGTVESLRAAMLDERLSDLTQRPDAPFLEVSSSSGAMVRALDAASITVEAAAGGPERALKALLAEVRRAALYGFTAAELARAKANLLRSWEQIYAEREKSTSSQFAGQYAANFLYGGPLLDIATEYRLQRALIPRITLEEVNNRARAWPRRRGGRAVLVSVPEKRGTAVPAEARIAAVYDSVLRATPAPFTDTDSDAPLLRAAPAPGRIVAERVVPEVGVTEWRLSNGARVLLKPTSFRADEVLLSGRAAGGTSTVSDADFLDAQTATAAVQVGGVGELSVRDLQKRLAGKTASVGMTIDELSQGVSGYASPRDLETMFQLVYLYFTAPRRDSAAWEAYRQRAREAFRGRGASPETAFADSLRKILTRDDPRARPLTPESFDRLRLDRALALYRARFADASAFTFYIIGNFEPDRLRPLVERYLATLPATGANAPWRDRGVRPPRGIVRRVVRRGVEAKARTQLVFTGTMQFSRGANALLQALADVLEIRLRERLREDLGGAYGVGVGALAHRDPYPGYQLAIGFGSAPRRQAELVRAVFAEIEALRRDGPTPDEVAKVREERRRAAELSLRDNDYWAAQLIAYDRLGWNLRGIADPAGAAEISDAALRDAARQYLDTSNYVELILLPAR